MRSLVCAWIHAWQIRTRGRRKGRRVIYSISVEITVPSHKGRKFKILLSHHQIRIPEGDVPFLITGPGFMPGARHPRQPRSGVTPGTRTHFRGVINSDPIEFSVRRGFFFWMLQRRDGILLKVTYGVAKYGGGSGDGGRTNCCRSFEGNVITDAFAPRVN